MTNREIIAAMPKGEIVNNKQILAAMKRKGLIYDYSPWGYLESARISYTDTWKDTIIHDHVYEELFPDCNGNDINALEKCYESREMLREVFTGADIEYLGERFSTKYLDGCFKPYLVKISGSNENEVEHRMSCWGNVI